VFSHAITDATCQHRRLEEPRQRALGVSPCSIARVRRSMTPSARAARNRSSGVRDSIVATARSMARRIDVGAPAAPAALGGYSLAVRVRHKRVRIVPPSVSHRGYVPLVRPHLAIPEVPTEKHVCLLEPPVALASTGFASRAGRRGDSTNEGVRQSSASNSSTATVTSSGIPSPLRSTLTASPIFASM